jgi:D-threo-aldose 1-dehydrogenase
VLAALGTGYGTRAQAALRFVLANHDFACAVVGLAEPAHLEEALAAVQMGPLPQSALTALDRVYESEFARL